MQLPSFLALPVNFTPNNKVLAAFVHKFSACKILIVGDVIADQFVYGAINRVSREAPVFILRHEQTQTLPGGAANAAANVAACGGQSVLLGIIGTDAAGNNLRENLAAANVETSYLMASDHWQTTTKMRILAGQTHAPRQQVIRLDYENDTQLTDDLETALANSLNKAAAGVSAIIISDYNYGVAGKKVTTAVRKIAKIKNIPVLVDSRFRLSEFGGATSATPNQDEVEQLLGQKFANSEKLTAACLELREKLDLGSLLVTRGADGMLLIERGAAEPLHIPVVGSLEPVDVTGAGDTVMATYALAISAGANFSQAAQLANHAGGIVVMKRGTATVTQRELLLSLQNQ
ncbi:MAG: PfkB family carbohydrate kinase [Pyrinomonadaceae bacterium]